MQKNKREVLEKRIDDSIFKIIIIIKYDIIPRDDENVIYNIGVKDFLLTKKNIRYLSI